MQTTQPFAFAPADMRDMARLRVRPPWWWLALFIVFAGLPFAIGMWLVDRSPPQTTSWLWTFAPLGVLVVCLYVGLFFYRRALFSWTLRHSGEATTSPRTVSIDETGLTVETGQSRSWIGWRAIIAIKRGRRGVYYFMQPTSAVPVADSAFDTPEARDAFHAAAKNYWERARQTPT